MIRAADLRTRFYLAVLVLAALLLALVGVVRGAVIGSGQPA